MGNLSLWRKIANWEEIADFMRLSLHTLTIRFSRFGKFRDSKEKNIIFLPAVIGGFKAKFQTFILERGQKH